MPDGPWKFAVAPGTKTNGLKPNRNDLMNPESSRPTVSVIIVSWNAKDYLMQCLASVSPEACRFSMEVIVVDNASSDGSADMVAKLYPETILIRNSQNLGFSRANNLAIRESKGRYLCLINSDVKVLPGCIDALLDYCTQHPEVGMVGPTIIGRDGNLQRSCRGFPTVWNMTGRALALDRLFPARKCFAGYSLSFWKQDSLRPVDILTGCFWLVRKQALDDVGLLDESFFMYGEDMDWCKRFWQHGWPIVFVPHASAIHYGGASSANSPMRFYIERQKADLQYWRKHHSRAGAFSYFLISGAHMLLRAVGYSVASMLRRAQRAAYHYKVRRSLSCLKWMLLGDKAVNEGV